MLGFDLSAHLCWKPNIENKFDVPYFQWYVSMTSLVTLASNVSLIIRLSNNDRSGRKNRKRRRKSHLQKKIIEKMTAAHLLADWKADRLSQRKSGRASITLNQGDPKRFLERRVVTVFAHHVTCGKSNKYVILLVAQAWRKWTCCPRG